MSEYRWIMYTSQNIPDNTSFDLTRHPSLQSARDEFEDYCAAVYTNDCSATLYPFSDENWDEALEFKNAGSPFGYPSYLIERGPMGGITVEAC